MPNPPTDVNYFGPAPGSVGQNPGGGPPNGGPLGGWGPAMDSFPPQHGNGNHYYYYYNAGPPPRTQNSQDNTRDALAQEGKLDIQKPEPFIGRDPRKWRIFLTQCLTMFQAKPITFQLESSRVAFAASYLQGIAFDHYTTLLWFDPNNPVLSNWLAFTQEFLSKFGVFDTVAEAEENLFNLRMHDNERFTTFIDVLRLAPKQTTYDGYKVLITQVNQRYWEDCSKNTAPWTSWNTSGNTNWQAGATNGIRPSIPANPANPAPRFLPGQGVPNTNRPLGQRPPAQLNAADLHDTPVPLDTNPNDRDDIPDPADNQEALCTNRIQDSQWIDVPEETQEKRQKEGACILCGLEDALDCGPHPDVFSTPATLLCAMMLAPDNPPAHLPSHSSTNLLLHTTLPFTNKPVPTLVNSGATNNFVDKSLAALAPQPLRRLPAPIPLKLFDGDSTPNSDYSSQNYTPPPPLTLRLDRDNPTDSGLVPFHVSPPSESSETTINQPGTPPQLCSRSARLFVIYVQLGGSLKVLPALIDSGASGVFLQLFDRSPTTTRITQYHDNTLTLDNDLQFQAQLLVTQLPPSTPIMLGLLWLRDVNPNINWKNLTMQFPGPKASLAATIHLRFQSIPDPDATPDPTATPTVPNPINSGNLDIKIISALQVTPALPEEYLRAGTTTPEKKTEEQILSKVVPPEYHKFADVFSEGSAKELPLHCSYNHQIDLEEGTSPPFDKIYNMSEIELQALKEYLDNMLSKGFIHPSISAAGAPVLFAKKKDGSLRLCVDYRGLNKVTKNRYPLPLIGDLVDRLCSTKIYTKIDLRSSYNNVRITPGHEWKTAFCTRYGLFEYLIMPFGMTNSPATFQYFMNNIFHDMNDIFVIVYLDNILIYSNSLAEHLEHIRHCSFHTAEVEYLGVIVTPDGVRMDPAKVDAILNWPSPRNVKEKDTPWDWDSKCQSVFLLLKKAFTSALVLRHFDPSLPIVLECDASNYAIAGILSQLNSGGKDLHPVTFYT
ncbi:hypothetical protein E4T56_gene3712 [Termitomyces sp. T112]|nr:hypothetical protein E4T56_gene3712 [Termitomyces sp. T112]